MPPILPMKASHAIGDRVCCRSMVGYVGTIRCCGRSLAFSRMSVHFMGEPTTKANWIQSSGTVRMGFIIIIGSS